MDSVRMKNLTEQHGKGFSILDQTIQHFVGDILDLVLLQLRQQPLKNFIFILDIPYDHPISFHLISNHISSSLFFCPRRFAQLLHPPTHHRKDSGFAFRNTRLLGENRCQNLSQPCRRQFSRTGSRAYRSRRRSSPARSAPASNLRHRGRLKDLQDNR